jgi:hypothetical protein
LEAARRLKRRLKLEPFIIALTAHAMVEIEKAIESMTITIPSQSNFSAC